MLQVKDPKDVPNRPHYCVLVYKTVQIHVPCQGHGYPAYTDTHNTFEHWITESKEDLENFIGTLHYNNHKFTVLHVDQKLSAKMTIQVSGAM